jgi:hypothetical protein
VETRVDDEDAGAVATAFRTGRRRDGTEGVVGDGTRRRSNGRRGGGLPRRRGFTDGDDTLRAPFPFGFEADDLGARMSGGGLWKIFGDQRHRWCNFFQLPGGVEEMTKIGQVFEARPGREGVVPEVRARCDLAFAQQLDDGVFFGGSVLLALDGHVPIGGRWRGRRRHRRGNAATAGCAGAARSRRLRNLALGESGCLSLHNFDFFAYDDDVAARLAPNFQNLPTDFFVANGIPGLALVTVELHRLDTVAKSSRQDRVSCDVSLSSRTA